MKHYIYIIFFLFEFGTVCSQETLNPSFEKYYRPSVTYLMLDRPEEKYNSQMRSNFQKTEINPKFDNHNLENEFLLKTNSSVGLNSSSISNLILSQDISKKVISKWYNQQKDGKFNMDFIAKRGLYNASDNDVMRAKAGVRGVAALEDAGEELIKKSYIVVFDFQGIETYEDYYDRLDAQNERLARLRKQKPVRVLRTQQGYRGNAVAYCYKVQWNDSLQQTFYENAWNNPTYFQKMTIPFKYSKMAYLSNIDGSQAKFNPIYSDDKLVQMLHKEASERALQQFASIDRSLRVKTSIFETRPLSAKIGKKEDVKIDQRFFVYELVQGADDKKVPTYKGVIRATKNVIDNRNDATGTSIPTRFYQESGKKLYPGMMIEQDQDAGISFNAGWFYQRLQGPFVRLDINLASIFNVSQLKLYIQGYLGFGTVKFGNSPTTYKAECKGIEIGFSKTYMLFRNIHIEPNVGFIIDTTHTFAPNFSERELLKNAKTKINIGQSQLGFTFGLRLPINLKYNIQIVPSVSMNTLNFNSEKTLFGKTLPQEFPNGILNTTGNQQGADNTGANLGISPYRYDISVRFKF